MTEMVEADVEPVTLTWWHSHGMGAIQLRQTYVGGWLGSPATQFHPGDKWEFVPGIVGAAA